MGSTVKSIYAHYSHLKDIMLRMKSQASVFAFTKVLQTPKGGNFLKQLSHPGVCVCVCFMYIYIYIYIYIYMQFVKSFLFGS
jgi:hypothetical protein